MMTSTNLSLARVRDRLRILVLGVCVALLASSVYEVWEDYDDSMRRVEERALAVAQALAQHAAQIRTSPTPADPIGLPIAMLDSLHQAIRINPGDSLLVVRDDGIVLFRAPASAPQAVGSQLPFDAPLIRQSRTAEAGVVKGSVVYDGVERIVAFRRVDGTPLLIVAGVAVDGVLQRGYRHAMQEIAMTGILLSILVVLGWQLQRRLADLRRATDEITAAQLAAQRALQRVNQALGAVADGIIAIDQTGRIEIFNHTAEVIFGYPATEVIGKNVRILMPEPFRGEHDTYLASYLRTGTARVIGRGREVVGRRRDGRVFPLDLAVSEIPSAPDLAPAPRRFVAVARDASERKRLESELRSAKSQAEMANRAKGNFLAHMSHELRTPLNAVIGYSEVIAKQLLGNDPVRYAAYAQDIHKSGTHLLELINDVLDMSKIEAGRYVLDEEPVDVAKTAETCLGMVRLRAEEGRVALVEKPFRAPVTLRADARALRQILLNLLSNAVKFTPEGGTVSVAWSIEESGEMSLSVADTGVGIAPAVQARLFEPFERGETNTARRAEGTGLGLAITKNLVELHGGTTVLTSTPGRGTTVALRFPAERLIPAAS